MQDDKNPYNFTKEDLEQEIARREKIKQEAKAHQDAVMRLARSCINTDEFKMYREKYEKAQESLIEEIIDFKETDPLRYAFEISTMLNNLRSIRMLLKEVKRDARTKG